MPHGGPEVDGMMGSGGTEGTGRPLWWMLLILVGLVVAMIAKGMLGGRDADDDADAGADSADEQTTIPAAHVSSDEALGMQLTVNADGKTKHYELTSPHGVARLQVEAIDKPDGVFGFGRCSLTAPNRKDGTGFVRDVAQWLGVPVPPSPDEPNPLEPLECTYALLGTSGDSPWLVRKLFFELPDGPAEVYLRVVEDEGRAELIEKDPDYREPLVASLAVALRDGPTPRRTAATDPNLESDEPIFTKLEELAGAPSSHYLDWVGDEVVVASPTDEGEELLHWADLETSPATIAKFQDTVMTVVGNGRHRVALVIVEPQERHGVSSADPGRIVVVDLDSAAVETLIATNENVSVGMFASLVWSPDGSQLAVGVDTNGDGGPHKNFTVVYDVGANKEVARTEQSLDVDPSRWTSAGLELRTFDFVGDDIRVTAYRWQPGDADPLKLSPSDSGLWSPDGRSRLAVTESALRIETDGESPITFEPTRSDDRAHLERLAEDDPTWLDERHLLIESDEPLALSLDTGKLRRLFDNPKLMVAAIRADGKAVIAKDSDGKLFWAERRDR